MVMKMKCRSNDAKHYTCCNNSQEVPCSGECCMAWVWLTKDDPNYKPETNLMTILRTIFCVSKNIPQIQSEYGYCGLCNKH